MTTNSRTIYASRVSPVSRDFWHWSNYGKKTLYRCLQFGVKYFLKTTSKQIDLCSHVEKWDLFDSCSFKNCKVVEEDFYVKQYCFSSRFMGCYDPSWRWGSWCSDLRSAGSPHRVPRFVLINSKVQTVKCSFFQFKSQKGRRRLVFHKRREQETRLFYLVLLRGRISIL